MTVFYFSSFTAPRKGKYTRERIEEEVVTRGVDFKYIHLKDVSIEYVKGEMHVLVSGERLDFLDAVFIMRKFGDEYSSFSFTFFTLLSFAMEKGITVFNGESFSVFPHLEDKLFQQTYFSNKGFPVIEKSHYFSTIEQCEKTDINFPILAKPRTGMCGDGVALFECMDDIRRYFFKNDITNHIFQRFVKNTYDLRVVTSKDGVIGAIKRFRSSGIVNNFAAGGSVEVFKLDSELEKLCVDICNSVKAHHLGIDLIFDEVSKEYYLLEVNRFMAFEGFEKASGQNYAKTLIESIL